jgi:hypothetical protein
VISSGCEISERWLAFTSMVLAPIRLAMKGSRSGLMVRSSVETASSWAGLGLTNLLIREIVDNRQSTVGET